MTQMLVSVSHLFAGYWWLMLLVILAAIILFKRFQTTEQGRRSIEQPAGLGGVEQEGRPPVGFPPPGRAQRRGVQPLLGHGPVQEAAEVADEVVEAAGPWSWPGRGELIQEAGGELAQVRHAVLAGERQQQAQRRLLRPVFAAERPLVSEEVADGGGEVVVHDRTSSPSPRATWRSASTATLA